MVSSLPQILSNQGPLQAVHPADGDRIEAGTISVAPPDHHLLIEDGRVLVKRGPKENRNRPSVDALFRSAAYSHGPKVIGIVLSGALDDGTSGLWSIKRLGGVPVVQDPSESLFDSMPSNALNQVEIDYCLSAHEMGALVSRLTKEAASEQPAIVEQDRRKMKLEVEVAIEGDAFRKGMMKIGELTPFTCPECQGVLMRLKEGKITRFRCHTGHGFSARFLAFAQAQEVEEAIWAAVRALHEKESLLKRFEKRARDGKCIDEAAEHAAAADRARRHADALRAIVKWQGEDPVREGSSQELAVPK